MRQRCFVYALDISISMGKAYGDLIPSKLNAAIEAILVSSKRIIEENGYIGLVLFAGKAFPVLSLTRDQTLVYSTLSFAGRRTFEASAPGDAIVEATKLFLNRERYCSERHVIVLSDGEYNMGIPLDAALLLARNSRVRLHYIVLGDQGQDKIGVLLPKLKEIYNIGYKKVLSKQELLAEITKIVRGDS